MGWWKSLAYVFCKSATAVRQLPLGPSTATVATSDHSWKTRNEKLQIQNGYMATLLRYRPRPYLGRVVMLNDENSMAGDPTFGWSELISGKIEIRTSRGDHDSYIGEHAQSAAEMLEVCLNEVSIDILKAEERRKARNAGSDTGAPVVSRDRNAVGCVSPAGQITSGND